MAVTLVCYRCKIAVRQAARPWFPVTCTACGNRMVVFERQPPPEGYRDHLGQVIGYPRYSPTPPISAPEASTPSVDLRQETGKTKEIAQHGSRAFLTRPGNRTRSLRAGIGEVDFFQSRGSPLRSVPRAG